MNPFELIEYTKEGWEDFFLGLYNELSSLYWQYDSLQICDIVDNYFDAYLVKKFGLVTEEEFDNLPIEEQERRLSAMKIRVDSLRERGRLILIPDMRRISVYHKVPIPKKSLWKDGYVPFMNHELFKKFEGDS